MKLSCFFFLVAGLTAANAGNSQGITLKEKNASLQEVLAAIKSQTGYQFLYTGEAISKAEKVSIDVKNASLEETLNLLFLNQPLTYTVVDRTVIIKPKPGSEKTEEKISVLPPTTDITGRITNAQGEPLSGASIIIKRTGKGDIADANGKFSIKNVNADDVIEISFTGYKTQSIKVGDRSNFTLVLDVAVDELDRVQIQAYGKTTARLRTGNIATVTAEEIERQPVMNPLLALQGKVAGLDVTQTSGYASAPVKIELRGRNLLGANPSSTVTSDPLYIIDGVPLTIVEVGGDSRYNMGSTGFLQTGVGFNGPAGGQSPFFNINPKDIESIEVLKDADATAIYGSRAANGVILITTKKGKAGKTQFNINVNQGINKVTRFWNMLNTTQYLAMRREAFKNSGQSMTNGNAYDLLVWDTTRYTDWQRALYGGTGKNTDIQLSLSGGDARTSFRIGVGYNRTTNILTVSGADQRASGSFNLTHRSLTQKLSISLTNSYSFTQSDMISLPGRVNYAPNSPSIYDVNGNLNYSGWAPIRNQYPFATLKQPYISKTNFNNTNLSLSYQILKGLNLKTSLGYNQAQANQESFIPIASLDPTTNPTGSANFGFNSNKNWIIEPQASYETFLGKGKISALIGGSIQEAKTSGTLISGWGYTNDALLKTVSNAPNTFSSENYGEYRYAAVFSRVTYIWQNKYIVNLNLRRDGSSKFGTGNQYGNFGSLGGAWIFSEESFIRKGIKFLRFGKIRGSYGITGGDGVGDYAYLTRWGSVGTQIYGGVQPIKPTQHANPDFRWQVNKKIEAALDLGFIDRINLSIAWYRNRCGNQLINFPTPTLTGFASVVANSPALVENSGWEFNFSSQIINGTKFKWSMSFNTAINRNKLISYPFLEKSPFANTLVVGQPLNIVKVLHYTGVDPQTGKYTFDDKNKDGTISTSPGPNDDRYIRHLNPQFFGGLGMNLEYSSFSLSLLFNIKKQIGRNAVNQGVIPGPVGNQPVGIFENRWQNPGDNVTTARFTTLPDVTDSYFINSDGGYTDASFIRLSNLSFAYGLPERFTKKMGMQRCRVSFNTNNIFVITNYNGIDPETTNFGGLPPAKTFVCNISFNF